MQPLSCQQRRDVSLFTVRVCNVHSSTSTPDAIDETLCALCQEHSNTPLQCLVYSKWTNVGTGYERLGDNLTNFRDLDEKPVPIDVCRLDERDGFAATRSRNLARWHASFRLKYSLPVDWQDYKELLHLCEAGGGPTGNTFRQTSP